MGGSVRPALKHLLPFITARSSNDASYVCYVDLHYVAINAVQEPFGDNGLNYNVAQVCSPPPAREHVGAGQLSCHAWAPCL